MPISPEELIEDEPELEGGPPGLRLVDLAPEAAGGRLDKSLADLLPELSRARVQGLLAHGLISLDGKPLRDASAKAKAGTTGSKVLPRSRPSPSPRPSRCQCCTRTNI
jgi:23S rRNA pseudouridine1911/1915/1917 synthase